MLDGLWPSPKLALMPSLPRLALLSAVAVSVLAQPGTANAIPPSYSTQERAAAIASPSLVYVEAHLDGFLQDKKTGRRLHDSPITVVTRCSGFAVGADGFVVTATRCLMPSPGALRGSASYTLANLMIRDKKLAPEKKDEYTRSLIETSEFVGSGGRQSMEQRIFGQLFRAFGGLTTIPAVAGRVVDFRPPTASDVALLKFDTTLPVAELSTEPLDAGTTAVLIGFSTSDAVPDAASYTIRSGSARITGEYKAKAGMYELDSDIGRFSLGGMVVDGNGRVIGMINADTTQPDDPNRVVADLTAIQELMNAAHISNALAPGDQTFRTGLDAYFAGRYSEAIHKLDMVIAATPSHSVAISYREQAAVRLAVEGKEPSGLPDWAIILIIALAVALVGLATLTAVIFIRNRRRAEPSGPWDYAPISGVPVSVLPISGGGYGIPADTSAENPTGERAPSILPYPPQTESQARISPEDTRR